MSPIKVNDQPPTQEGLAVAAAVKPIKGATEAEKLAIKTVRVLGCELTQQYKGGHPGTVMGAAGIGLALWKYVMNFNPSNPDWLARDRFVLSAGHACLLQYIYLHLSGYSAWTLDQIRAYHSPTALKDGTIAAGHPEIEFPGVEVTTGPLGQGIANAVGLAIAGKQIAAQYDRPGYAVAGESKVFCFTGDGCLQEGVGQESISLAGHLGLDNLILIYDQNKITVDGNIDSCFSEDTSAKLKAMGWHIIEVKEGTNDLHAVVDALEEARAVKGKPVLVNIESIIGFPSNKQNSGAAHGAALGEDEVTFVKKELGFDLDKKFYVPDEVYEFFSDVKPKGEKLEADWNAMMAKYAADFPAEHKELQGRLTGNLPDGWRDLLPAKSALATSPQATRKSHGTVLQALAPVYKNFVAGSADLMESTFVNFKGHVDFQNPATGLGDYTGRQIRYGIREFAMVALANGMAAWHKGTFLPVVSTFFMFWIYAAPAARMSALQGLRVIGIATHDCIGIGEDGPTHQPIALAAFYRSLPNFNYLRPADAEEVVGAYELALDESNASTPSLLSLSRQAVPLLAGSDRSKVKLGGYVVHSEGDASKPDLTIVSTGSEVWRCVDAAKALSSSIANINVVSMPSQEYFDRQSRDYRLSVLPTDKSLVVAVEPYASDRWPKYAHASLSMTTFGHSAPEKELFEHYGFGVEGITSKIGAWFAEKSKAGALPGVGEFDEILLNLNAAH